MSIDKKQLSCVCCKAYLFEDDDVVYCPVCGAPHHRDCYNKLGHCALEELHGTENEYDAQKEAEKKQTSTEETPPQREPDLGRGNFETFGGFQSFDFLGGVPKDLELEDGITAEQTKNFVLANTHRYIPKFVGLNPKNKISWNWMAFLFPCGWFFSRKMYKNGVIAGIFTIIATLLTYPFTIKVEQMGTSNTINYPEMMEQIMELLPNVSKSILLIFIMGAFFNILIRVICGMFGDYIYKKHVMSTLKEINKNSEDVEFDCRKKGGVNIFSFFIGTMLVQNLPFIIFSFI